MIPKYDLSDFIFMVTALVFHQHASKRQQKKLILQAWTSLKGEKKVRKQKQYKQRKKLEKKQNKAKQNQKNVLNCFGRAANKFRSEFMDKYGKLAGHTVVKWSKPSLTLDRCILMRNVAICFAIWEAVIAELWRAKRASGAPWVRKWSNQPIRENLVITWSQIWNIE